MKVVMLYYILFTLLWYAHSIPFGPGSTQWSQLGRTFGGVLNTAQDLQRQPSMHAMTELGNNLQNLYNQLLSGGVDVSKLQSLTAAISIIQEASLSGSLELQAAHDLSAALEKMGFDLLSLDSKLFKNAQLLTQFHLESSIVADVFKGIGVGINSVGDDRSGAGINKDTLAQMGLIKPLTNLQQGISQLELNPTDVDQWADTLLNSEKITSNLKSAIKGSGLIKKTDISGQTVDVGTLLPLSKLLTLAKSVGIESGIDFGFSASGDSALALAAAKLLGDVEFLNKLGLAEIDTQFLNKLQFSKELEVELSKSLLLSLDALAGKELLGNFPNFGIGVPSFDNIHNVVDNLPNPFEIFEMIPHLGKNNILAHMVNAAQTLHTLELDIESFEHWAAALHATEMLLSMTKEIAGGFSFAKLLNTKSLLDIGHIEAHDVIDITGLSVSPDNAIAMAQSTADKLLKNVEVLDQLGFGVVDLSSVDLSAAAKSPRGFVADFKFPQTYVSDSGLEKILQLHDVSQSLERFGSHFSNIQDMNPLQFVSAAEELENLISHLQNLHNYLSLHGGEQSQIEAVSSALEAAVEALATMNAEFEIQGSANLGASIEKVLGSVAELSGPFQEMGHVFNLPINFDLLKDIDLAVLGDGSFSLRGNLGGRLGARKSVLGSLASMTGS